MRQYCVSPQGHVVMNTQPPSIYQRVIDKTKALAFQSQFIAQNIDKRLSSQAAMVATVLPTPAMVCGEADMLKAGTELSLSKTNMT